MGPWYPSMTLSTSFCLEGSSAASDIWLSKRKAMGGLDCLDWTPSLLLRIGCRGGGKEGHQTPDNRSTDWCLQLTRSVTCTAVVPLQLQQCVVCGQETRVRKSEVRDPRAFVYTRRFCHERRTSKNKESAHQMQFQWELDR